MLTSPENDHTPAGGPVVSPHTAIGTPSVVTVTEPVTATHAAVTMDQMLTDTVQQGGSDLHVQVGLHPAIRVLGHVTMQQKYGVISGEALEQMIKAIVDTHSLAQFERDKEMNFAYEVAGVGRFRGNLSRQRGSVKVVFRHIPWRIPNFDELGLPVSIREWVHLKRGLVLFTGATGSGKSHSGAALIDAINSSRAAHILTVEDPVEFVHQSKQSLVAQRQLGDDTTSFAESVKNSMRQDIDVLQIGEIRDTATAEAALAVAETGHLVLSTLHTSSAEQTLHRLLDFFPANQQQVIRSKLAHSLHAVVCQQLLENCAGDGRVLNYEVMVASQAIRHMIRSDRIEQIKGHMETAPRTGPGAMITRDWHLAQLVRESRISPQTAAEASDDADSLAHHLGLRSVEQLLQMDADMFRDHPTHY